MFKNSSTAVKGREGKQEWERNGGELPRMRLWWERGRDRIEEEKDKNEGSGGR